MPCILHASLAPSSASASLLSIAVPLKSALLLSYTLLLLFLLLSFLLSLLLRMLSMLLLSQTEAGSTNGASLGRISSKVAGGCSGNTARDEERGEAVDAVNASVGTAVEKGAPADWVVLKELMEFAVLSVAVLSDGGVDERED